MDAAALRAVIRQKLQDGRLPLDRIPRLCGGPANGEVCDACDKPITQLVMEGITDPPKDKKPFQFHVQCFQIWEAERRRPFETS